MKKVYIPSMDLLYKMQDMVGAEQLYNYLLAKVVESLIINKQFDKSVLEGATKGLREKYDLCRAICYLYPEEISFSEAVQYDNNLAVELLNREKSNSIYNIDAIRNFDSSTLYSSTVVLKVIKILNQELEKVPTYRFEYQDNLLLDSIFGVEIDKISEHMYKYGDSFKKLNNLIGIEPAYGVILPDENFHSEINRKYCLVNGIGNYLKRYNISSLAGYKYTGQDILTKPDDKVKKLIRCIKKQ